MGQGAGKEALVAVGKTLEVERVIRVLVGHVAKLVIKQMKENVMVAKAWERFKG